MTGALRSAGCSNIVDIRQLLFPKHSLLCSGCSISKRFGRRLASVAAGSSGLSIIYWFLNL